MTNISTFFIYPPVSKCLISRNLVNFVRIVSVKKTGEEMGIKKILILDDEIDMAHTIGDMLDFVTGEFEHLIAHTADEALSLVDNHVFDCIISDIHLPGIDGLGFIQKLRAQGNQTPVIITSGLNEHGIKERIQKVGGFDFLPKPFDISNVSDIVLASLKVS